MKQISLRRNRGSSIRKRVLTIALVPSVALLLVGVVLAGYLIYDAVTGRDYTNRIRGSEAPSIPFLASARDVGTADTGRVKRDG